MSSLTPADDFVRGLGDRADLPGLSDKFWKGLFETIQRNAIDACCLAVQNTQVNLGDHLASLMGPSPDTERFLESIRAIRPNLPCDFLKS